MNGRPAPMQADEIDFCEAPNLWLNDVAFQRLQVCL